ncbi:hypothetical protein FPZ24_10730 [Sphingomonas panacisoli]|uniref:Uncharacterized protein n=1 Tax=Sphingomonas panacisoli TaxID=1813879 RepID=A0A5B8LK27_9SPHN|nr:hypothetical protein [Sphingomonas panacisoli]QDZ07902.1 hypothetical protein FPZ24_10730 [Sphingomonas panacisoli]
MPYRRAWLFIVALIAATVFAFWRSYFGIFARAPAGFHIHGLTASLWMLLLLAQSWTVDRRQFVAHRILGRATFVAIPLFGAGAMGVIHSMAASTVDGDPFYALWGARLGLLDLLAFGAVLYAAGMALRHRRNVRLHAAYMLSTALPLVSPVLGRVINQTVPGLVIHGPQDFPVFGLGAQLANLIAGGIALWLWRWNRSAGRPWAVAFGVVVAQIVSFETLATGDVWHGAFEAIGSLPLTVPLALGFGAGVVTVLIGWNAQAGRRAAQPATA